MIFSYDIPLDNPMPRPGQHLVSVGKKGIGSVWLIKAARPVRSTVVEPGLRRYALTVQPMPDLKPLADLEGDIYGCAVWVRGDPALPIVWYPRKAKQQP